jgi:hypothetical protein
MKYDPIEPVSRVDAEAAFVSGDRDAVVRGLIGLALHDDDWHWVQSRCLGLCGSPDIWVQRACATALVHLARIHRRLDPTLTDAIFKRLFENPELKGEVQEALEEVRFFLRSDGDTAQPDT